MSTLRLYVWKEWREHRLALLMVALIAVGIMSGAWFVVPLGVLHDPLFPSVSGLVGVLLALLAVGGELLSERRSSGLNWLERLPAGHATPFWAKLLFHVPLTLAAGLLGIALAFVAAWTRGVAPETVDDLGLALLLLGALFSLWTFAASAWSSRSVLALFSAGFVLAGLGVPIWYLGLKGYQMQPWEFWTGVTLLLVGWFPSAWLGFVVAGRFGRGPGLGGALGFSAAVASFLPFWGWSAWQLHERDRFDPDLAGFEIRSAVVTDDVRTAFVEAWVRNDHWHPEAIPASVLRVDLEDGTWETLLQGDVRLAPWNFNTADCREADNVHIYARGEQTAEFTFYLASGKPVGAKDELLPTSRCGLRRGWLTGRAPFRADSTLIDVIDGTVLHPGDLRLPPDAKVWSDLGRWFVISLREGASRLDPTTGVLERAEWLDVLDDEFGPRLPDGRFFAPLRTGGVALVDPGNALVTPLIDEERIKSVYRAYGRGNLPFEEGEVVLLRTSFNVLRFDSVAETLVSVPFLRNDRAIGSARDGSVFALTDAALVRLDPASGATTQLFPRPR